MIIKSLKPLIWLGLFIFLVGLACGTSDTPPPPSETSPQTEEVKTSEPAVETEAVSPSSNAVGHLQDVKKATVQIEGQGSFIDPEFGLIQNGAGRGSGFIIDPSGIAVTNNHVVTGAALLQVWVGGESSPRNAKVLGVSECSDLAVIDIDGSGFDYLAWHEGPIDVGMDIYVAGFPLGDPEYTLTKGVISKQQADGETYWSSVDSVLEYDAVTNPGNSGGPVVTPDGKVVAVNYASNSETRQAFGISRDVAMGIIEDLESGNNVDTMGVNGQAVGTEDGSITGVWIASVQSGSPADQAQLEPGDIITEMENLVLATDGTMSQYCDILRSHTPGDTLSLQVLRWSTGEVFEGQLNGRELELVGTLEGGSGGETGSGDVDNPSATESGDVYFYTDFDTGVDDWSYFLTNGTEDGFLAEADSSRLKVEINARDTWVYFIYEPYDYSDVRIDTIAENLGMNNNNVSLICRESDLGWYEFNIANNGEYTILWFDDLNRHDYVRLFSGGSTLINMGRDVNEYTAICQGESLTLGINGVEVRTIKDRNLKSGRVGLSVSSFNVTPIKVEFDYYTVTVP